MASVTYKINGKYDGKAVKKAKDDFAGLKTAVASIGNIAGAIGLTKLAGDLVNFAKGGKEAFLQQNAALTKFNTAVATTTLNTTKLKAIQDKISRNNFIDGDTINNAMALGVQMGLTEDQLKDVMNAASELTAGGFMSMDQAVKALSTSYSGNLGQLQKLYPELKNLTKEELANGDAVKKVIENYKGFSDAMSNTFTGRETQFKNASSDLQAAIASIFQSITYETQGQLLEPLNNITNWVIDNRNYIINAFLHLPEVAKTVFTSIKGIFTKTWENLPDIINAIGPVILNMGQNAFKSLFEIAKESFKAMGEILDFVIGNPFRSSKDFINTMLNNMIEGINKLINKMPNWLKKLLGSDDNGNLSGITFRFAIDNKDNNKTWEETSKKVEQATSKIVNSYKNGMLQAKKDWEAVLKENADIYGDNIAQLKEDLSKILGQDLPVELQAALDGMTAINGTIVKKDKGEGGDGGDGGDGENKGQLIAQAIGSGVNEVAGMFGEIGSLIQAGMQGGIWGVIAALLSKVIEYISTISNLVSDFMNLVSTLIKEVVDSGFIQALEELLQPFFDYFGNAMENLKMILNVISALFGAFAKIFDLVAYIVEAFTPVLEVIMTELEGIFMTIGEIIGDLAPVIKVIADVIANVIGTVLRVIYNVLVSFYNIGIDLYNLLCKWFNNNKGKKSKLSYLDITASSSAHDNKYDIQSKLDAARAQAETTSASSSGSATYTAAKDVYINIIYNSSYVNGDAREIALNLRNEIQAAERLGY